jgi:type I site-specific restriction endonuclease
MTDFFDDDLERVRRKDPNPDLQMGPSARSVEQMGVGEGGYTSGGELNLTQMSRHKVQVEDQVATAMKELERLRQRQENLQSQKNDLEELRKKQDNYEKGKRELLDGMNQSLVMLEKEEVNAEQLTEILAATRKQFKERIHELEELNDQNWEEAKFRTELTSALSFIDETRTEYTKAIAKIDAQRGHAASPVTGLGSSRAKSLSTGSPQDWTFRSALMTGFAFTLPLILSLLAFIVVYYLVTIGVL